MFKSLDYLEEIQQKYCLSKSELVQILELIGYFISDNKEEYDGEGARYLLDDVIETIEKDLL